jgi:hypothetical protein
VPGPHFSRREFLALSAGAAVLAACGTSSGSGGSSSKEPTTASPHALVPAVISADLYASPKPQRFAFTMLTENHQPRAGEAAEISLPTPDGSAGPFVPAVARGDGLPQFRGVYTVDATLPHAGAFVSRVRYLGKEYQLPFQVNDKPAAPIVGDLAPKAASPTKADPLGAQQICTRIPPCSLHKVSLSDVIGKGKPVLVLFATPEFCQTAYCGQVLDALLTIVPTYSEKVDIVHVEIYQKDPQGALISTVQKWNLQSEPWCFGVDGTGHITARLDSAFDRAEMKAILDGLVA